MTLKALAIPILVLGIWLPSPLAQASSYHIQLKNGREFKTHRMWEDGGEIRFSLPTGTMGVPKEAVRAIQEVGTLSGSRATTKPVAQRPVAPLASPHERLLSWAAAAEARTLSEGEEVTVDRVKKTGLQRAIAPMRKVTKKMSALAEAVVAKCRGILAAWWND
ncbi:MAG TPA: hypothetical protein VLK82_12385 [Candidatus Tectomicrobia bacterium]|nr:hypothetical protein [Candidatus Tectomicrobia bacterium]